MLYHLNAVYAECPALSMLLLNLDCALDLTLPFCTASGPGIATGGVGGRGWEWRDC